MTISICFVIGLVAIIGACFVHEHFETTMRRAKFVFGALSTTGAAPLSYALTWVLSGQQPTFSLKPIVIFGLTMWGAALAYGAVSLLLFLRQRDIAPSK